MPMTGLAALEANRRARREYAVEIVRDQGFDVDREGYRAAAEVHRIASGAGKAIGRMTGEEAKQYGV